MAFPPFGVTFIIASLWSENKMRTLQESKKLIQFAAIVLQWVHLDANDYGWVQNKARWVQHRAFVFLLETI